MKPLPSSDLQEIATRCADVFRELDGAHVLITGASGFVGSWMRDSALREWAREGGAFRDVTHCSRKETGTWTRGFGNSFTVPGTDIRQLTIPDGVTHVIHCASAGSHAENVDDPHKVAGMIVDGTKRVVRECERVGVKRLLVLSSGSVYVPKKDGSPYVETDPVQDHPVTLFGYAKRCAERWALGCGVPTVSARGFAMLGPRLPSQFAASEFMADALAGRPIRVTSPGTVRSYLYASDMAAWLWTLLVKGEAGTAYNVGGDKPLNVAALASHVAAEAGTTVQHGSGSPVVGFGPSVARAAILGLLPWTAPGNAVRRWLAWERGA